jgi:regulator of sigma E protease
MLTIWFVILAALGLGLLVFIHELGHYFVARRVGITVEAFGIGFGRPVFKWKRDGVEWRVNWIPFGGYVRMAGMEKKEDKQPYEIEGGFFAAKPLARIKVALAGPTVNIVFAFLLFTLIWATGGREKPFSEFTNHVGYVDPQSELFTKGLRPGDIITEYDGHELTGAADHLYAAMLAGNTVQVEGYHVDYSTGQRTPFDVQAATYAFPSRGEDMRTVGVLQPAQYLIYVADPAVTAPSFEAGDRLFWADGELIFSRAQLSEIINQQKALLTVESNGTRRLARVPRLRVADMVLTPQMKTELGDWHYEADLSAKLSDALFIPYNLSPDGLVERRVDFIDPEIADFYFPRQISTPVDAPLKRGDRILAVDGHPLTDGASIFSALQHHDIHVVVQRGRDWKKVRWKRADRDFDRNINWNGLQQLASGIGTAGASTASGNLVLLPPITPVSVIEMARARGEESQLLEAIRAQREEFLKIEDPAKRAEALQALREQQNTLMLGLSFTDRPVDYNPLPTTLFADATVQTWRTFAALFSGHLSPKFLSGPIGIVHVMQYSWSVGVKEALFWLAFVSLNLGILNLLPVPILDGGHICFSLWEIATRKRIKAETMEKLIIPFFVLLIGFFIFVTYQDLSRLVKGFF